MQNIIPNWRRLNALPIIAAIILGFVANGRSESLLFQEGARCRVVTNGRDEFSFVVPENLILLGLDRNDAVFLDKSVLDSPEAHVSSASLPWLKSCSVRVGDESTRVLTEYSRARASVSSAPLPGRAPDRFSLPILDPTGKSRMRFARHVPIESLKIVPDRRMAISLLRYTRPVATGAYWDGIVQEILRYDVDSGSFHQITEDGQLAFSPTPSPDGQWIAYYTIPQASNPEKLTDYDPVARPVEGAALAVVRPDGTG